jgi:hypothetical protein
MSFLITAFSCRIDSHPKVTRTRYLCPSCINGIQADSSYNSEGLPSSIAAAEDRYYVCRLVGETGRLPNYLNAHSSSPDSQRAAVQVWFGDIGACGTSPVAHLVRT